MVLWDRHAHVSSEEIEKVDILSIQGTNFGTLKAVENARLNGGYCHSSYMQGCNSLKPHVILSFTCVTILLLSE